MAISFDEKMEKFVTVRDNLKLINYELIGEDKLLYVNSAERYIPLIYSLGATNKKSAGFFCEEIVYVTISMRAFYLRGHPKIRNLLL